MGRGRPPASRSATPQPRPGQFGGIAQDLSFAWSTGYTSPDWLPQRIQSAPQAPIGGSQVCGVDVATRLYTALIRYDPQSPAGAVVIQIQAYAGPGTYSNTSRTSPVDVEVSPPRPGLVGLSGYGVAGSTVIVNADGTSGTVRSVLTAGNHEVTTIRGSWRCV